MRNYEIRREFIMQYLHDDKKRASNAEIADSYRKFIDDNKREIEFDSDFIYESFYANERIMLSARALSKKNLLKIFQEAKFKRIFYEIL